MVWFFFFLFEFNLHVMIRQFKEILQEGQDLGLSPRKQGVDKITFYLILIIAEIIM